MRRLSVLFPASKVSLVLLCLCGPAFAQSTDAESKLIVTGRVVDTNNKPIPNVNCSLRRIPVREPGDESMADKSTATKLNPSASDGTVRTSRLKTGDTYVLEFAREGYVPAFSHRTHRKASGEVQVRDVVLRRLRTVRGVVVNSEGKPLQGVNIRQAGDGPRFTQAQSNARGEFQLDGVPEGLALVFAGHPDYWFTGRRAPIGDTDLRITLTRRSKPNPERCDTKQEPIPDTAPVDESAVQFDQVVEQFKNADQLGERVQLGYRLIALDYKRARKVFAQVDPPAGFDEAFHAQSIAAELKDDFQNGLARIREIGSANARVEAVLYYILHDSKLESDQNRTLLARTITDLRAIDDPMSRIFLTSRILGPVHRAGLTQLTGQLVDECLELTESNEVGTPLKNAIGSLAEELSSIDPARARKLIAQSGEMYSAWIATGFADRQPKEAAKIIRAYKFDGIGGSRLGRVYILPRACYRMAHADVDDAMKLAELMDGVVAETPRYTAWDPDQTNPDSVTNRASRFLGQATGLLGAPKLKPEENPVAVLFKARVHGLIAEAIAESNPKRARDIVEAAANRIMSMKLGVRNERGGFWYSPSTFMASLVPVAATIDPGLGADICWRALAIRGPVPTNDGLRAIEATDLHVYPLLATIQSKLAAELFQVVAKKSAGQSHDGETFGWSLAHAWARIDRSRCRAWATSLSDRSIDGAPSPRESALGWYEQFASQENDRFGTSILDQTQAGLDSELWISVLLDREALHPRGTN